MIFNTIRNLQKKLYIASLPIIYKKEDVYTENKNIDYDKDNLYKKILCYDFKYCYYI